MTTPRENPEVAQQANDTAQLPGVSGRKVTVVVLLALAIVGGWVSYSLWCYSQIDLARASSAQAWRTLAEELSGRYRTIESLIAKGVDEESIAMEDGEKFQILVDRFRTTVQFAGQYAAAQDLEGLLTDVADLPAANSSMLSALTEFNDCMVNERSQLDRSGSRFLAFFLKFADPQELKLAP